MPAMTIELECSGCRQRLRVADEHAGQLARCPQCGATTLVPPSPMPLSSGPLSSGPMESPAARVVEPSPYTAPADRSNPYLASQVFPGGTSSNLPPHRGTMVLVFGI